MNRKKTISALQVVGSIFSFIGGIFCLVAIAILIFIRQREATVFGLIYISIGGVFLLFGLLFLFLNLRKNIRKKQMVENGYYVMGRVDRIIANVNVTYHNIHPYIVSCLYQDENGKEHRFNSRNLMFNPKGMLKDNQVRVYIEPGKYRHYMVDIDSILPNVMIHTFSGVQSKNQAVFLIGIIFTIMGSIFAGIGFAVSFLAMEGIDRWMFLMIFGGIGGIFLIIGVTFLIREIGKKRTVKKLIKRGQYVNAIIKSVSSDAGIEYSGAAGTIALKKNLQGAGSQEPIYTTNPLYCQCSYVDPSGVEHLFRSKSVLGINQEECLNQYVKVYYQGEKFQKYYVELNSCLL